MRVVPVAINISGLEFRNKDFGDAVARCLKQNGLPPDSLQLELTESVLMQGNRDAVSVMQTLKNLGVRLAIDDFGTGYSSLSYLKRFPVDTLKIDQSFVRDIVTNLDDSVIVSAVIAMGKSLGLRVVAEGVETQEQLDFLRHKNCDEGQGFLFSHALDDAEFALLLEGNAWPPGNRMQKPYGIRSRTLS